MPGRTWLTVGAGCGSVGGTTQPAAVGEAGRIPALTRNRRWPSEGGHEPECLRRGDAPPLTRRRTAGGGARSVDGGSPWAGSGFDRPPGGSVPLTRHRRSVPVRWRARGRASGAGRRVLPGGGAVRPARRAWGRCRCRPVRRPRPARARGPIAAGQIRVVMVVDPGETGPRGPMATCLVVAAGTSGSKILAQRAAELGLPSPRYAGSGLLCGLDGFPATACPVNNGGSFAFWAYFNGSGGRLVVRSRQPVRPPHGRRRDHGLALHHRLHRGRRPGAAHRAEQLAVPAPHARRHRAARAGPHGGPAGGRVGRRVGLGLGGCRRRRCHRSAAASPIRARRPSRPMPPGPRSTARPPRSTASAPPTRRPRPRSWPPRRPAARPTPVAGSASPWPWPRWAPWPSAPSPARRARRP